MVPIWPRSTSKRYLISKTDHKTRGSLVLALKNRLSTTQTVGHQWFDAVGRPIWMRTVVCATFDLKASSAPLVSSRELGYIQWFGQRYNRRYIHGKRCDLFRSVNLRGIFFIIVGHFIMEKFRLTVTDGSP